MRLRGHHALVTGGGTGIGAAIARVLAEEGAKLTLVGRRRGPLEEVANDIRSSRAKSRGAGTDSEKRPSTTLGTNEAVLVAPADVTEREEVDAAFTAARAANGPITILVNNAGTAAASPFAKVTPEAWCQVMAVNLDALLHCCQAALPDLLAAPSARIVTISSIAGLKGGAYIAPYVAAKHGAVGLTRAMAAEFAKTHLTVNAVCPGYVETDIVAGAIANIREKTGRSEEEARAALTATNPQGRLIQPEEVASTVLWLCLPESRSVNGQAIAITGGEA
ncbi:SDR family NAD(P)-dependent oxidoreductase [Sphingosinicella humi]|uniref:3-hydroxyacyl-CoA dehydrogenase n=1 Tax=Allosphingosinicella humi TaxID=2068657 RepID=A0A2U2IZW5_9SPHN|nr:SDR family oxidoreductase [Sphingosinicella humi]PWG01624.1 3-hydroxyacyl-CoA dehydrogenase [Sphingosinicella humi]